MKTLFFSTKCANNIYIRSTAGPSVLYYFTLYSNWSLELPVCCKQSRFYSFYCYSFSLMALTETWIKPEDTATPAALSTNFTFSHTPRMIERGGGTGLLISNEWKFDLLLSLTSNSSFESHAITITHPAKIHFVVVYRPPGQLGNFLEELDVLLSNFPEDGTPLVLLGDFNIHLEKPQATDFNTLLTSFDLKRVSTTATHKSGNQLDLIYTHYCSTHNTLVTPLHTSDHFLITSKLTLTPDIAHTPPQVTFRHNLRSLSLSRLSSMVSSALPSPSQFSALDINSATDTLCFTLTSCLDNFCPLSSRPARTTPSAPGCPMFSMNIVLN